MSAGIGASCVRWRIVALAGTLAVRAAPVLVPAEEPAAPASPVTRIEEDWVLWVYQPNGALFSPQFHTVMSPVDDLNSYYFQVTWNYRELPDFAPGGFQVQSWHNDTDLASHDVNNQELSRSAEIITWTQVLETNGNQIAFSLVNGRSATWGSFDHPRTTIVQDGSVSDLESYSPDLSIQNACITYGQNRVYVLRIREIRYYSDTELLWTDASAYDVYRQHLN
jgi:hypothetical protein